MSFKLAKHNGLWYCATQSINPLWGYGMPLSDSLKGHADYVEAVREAYEIMTNHYARTEHEDDVRFYDKYVRETIDKWLQNPTLDSFKPSCYDSFATVCHTNQRK